MSRSSDHTIGSVHNTPPHVLVLETVLKPVWSTVVNHPVPPYQEPTERSCIDFTLPSNCPDLNPRSERVPTLYHIQKMSAINTPPASSQDHPTGSPPSPEYITVPVHQVESYSRVASSNTNWQSASPAHPPSASSVSETTHMLHHLSMSPLSPFGMQHQNPQVLSSPVVTTLHADPSLSSSSDVSFALSPMARARRAPPISDTPPMELSSTPTHHTLDVRLPTSISREMVTICAKRGDKLSIVADAWHMERDCHYEWQVVFPPHDIDMNAVHAMFHPDGRLTIDVRRRPGCTNISSG